MRQRYHTIIKPEPNGWFVGWVEEVPGTITHGRSLDECRQNLRELLKYSLIVVATVPVLIVYPFVQKHFVRGALIGSLKG